MSDERRRFGGEELKVQGPHTIEESFSSAEGDRGNVGAQLMDATCGEVLVDRGGAACDGYVTLTPAAARAWSRAELIPSVTKVNVVPPRIVTGSRGWWVSTNTGAW